MTAKQDQAAGKKFLAERLIKFHAIFALGAYLASGSPDQFYLSAGLIVVVLMFNLAYVFCLKTKRYSKGSLLKNIIIASIPFSLFCLGRMLFAGVQWGS